MILSARYCENFKFIEHFSENFWKRLCWKHCKYKEWVSFFLGSLGMNRSGIKQNCQRTALRFMRFVCPALWFIPHEPRKKTFIPCSRTIFMHLIEHIVKIYQCHMMGVACVLDLHFTLEWLWFTKKWPLACRARYSRFKPWYYHYDYRDWVSPASKSYAMK